MEAAVRLNLWSDEDRWFVLRRFGLGYSLNLKYLAKRLGWIKATKEVESGGFSESDGARQAPQSREDRLREQIEASKYESDR